MGAITIQTSTSKIRDALGNLADGKLTIRPRAGWEYDEGGERRKITKKAIIVPVAAGVITPFALAPTVNSGVDMTDAAYDVEYSFPGSPKRTEVWVIDGAGTNPLELTSIQVSSSSDTLPGLPVAGAAGPAGPTGINWRGFYNAATPYLVDDGASYFGASYICIQAGTGNTPAVGGTAYWDEIAIKGAAGVAQIKVGSFTRDLTLASGNQVVSGVGFQLKGVAFLACVDVAVGMFSVGFDDGATVHKAIADISSSTLNAWLAHASQSIVLYENGGSIYTVGRVTAIGNDDFTVAWVKAAGSPSGTAIIQYLAWG